MEFLSNLLPQFASMTAVCASYAILMSIHQKNLNATWLRGEAVLGLAASAGALSYYFSVLTNGGNIFLTASTLFLILGFVNLLALVITHRFVLKHDKAVYSENLRSVTKLIAILAFSSLTLHILTNFAAIAGF